jgi:peptidoglycan hydrolase-like protein with peptidoglycan-binding domain
MTQWVSFSGFDLDLAESSLPFWDTQAKARKPPANPAPVPAWQEAMLNALPVVKLGDSGEDVRTVQGLCIARGHQVTVDGSFGPATHEAVVAVQAAAHIAGDGITGPATWPALIGV